MNDMAVDPSGQSEANSDIPSEDFTQSEDADAT